MKYIHYPSGCFSNLVWIEKNEDQEGPLCTGEVRLLMN